MDRTPFGGLTPEPPDPEPDRSRSRSGFDEFGLLFVRGDAARLALRRAGE